MSTIVCVIAYLMLGYVIVMGWRIFRATTKEDNHISNDKPASGRKPESRK